MSAVSREMGDRPTPPTSLRSPTVNWVWSIFLLGTLVFLIPITLLSRLPQAHIDLPVVLAFLSVAYSGLRLSFLALDGREQLLSLTFWVFAYIWMGIAPLVQLAAGEFPWPGLYSEDTLIYAGFVVLVGYIAYDLGSLLGNRRGFRFVSRVAPQGLSLSKQRIYLLAFLAIAIAPLAIFMFGGLQAMFSPRTAFNQEAISEFGSAGAVVWSSLLRAPPFIALLLLLRVWTNRGRLNVRGQELMMLGTLVLILLVLTFIVDNPVRTARFMFGAVILSLAFMLPRWNRRYSMSLWVLGFMVILLLVFPYTDLFRHAGSSLVLTPVTDQLLSNGDYDTFQMLANTVEFVSANGVTFGWQLLGVLTFWVPSSLWPGKPIGTGRLVAEYSGYSYTNLSSPLWAEAYINMGVAGLILAFFAYGAVTSLLQQKYLCSGRYSLSLSSVLVPLLAAYQIYFLRGALIATFAYLVPLVGYLLLAAKRKQYPKSSHRSEKSRK